MCLYALLLSSELKLKINFNHAIKLILLHDLPEVYAGDANPYEANKALKHKKEKAAADKLFPLLPPDKAKELRSLWDEYEAQKTPEAKFVRAIDRLQAFSQNVFTKGKTWKDLRLTTEQVRSYNKEHLNIDPVLIELFQLLSKRATNESAWPTKK
ncbi:MAG TPA: HD domain-containing protein [Candidatus Nanoarchaeia archaeon]|nr:HD domain-containing protein [Candidatus Nanoarchaeia archaeon]